MISQELFRDRKEWFLEKDAWQKEAVSEIKNKLIRVTPSENLSPFSDTEKGDKFVAFYGESQVGKTTAILWLMGIREEKLKEVGEILRGGASEQGGQALGNSSTATAIIYSQGKEEDRFFLRFGSEEGLYDAEELKEKIRNIRRKVEAGEAEEDILYLSIPIQYFQKKESSNIHILDLPGDGSDNFRERKYVNGVLTTYLISATVVVVACTASKIQTLENMKIPGLGDKDWKEHSEKYMVLITHSCSPETVRKYLCDNRDKQEKKTYQELLEEHYSEELKKILPEKIKHLLLDVGGSLDKLLSNKSLSENGKTEIKELLDYSYETFIEEVNARASNSTLLEYFGRLNSITSEIKYQLNSKIKNLEIQIEEINGEKYRLDKKIKKLEALEKQKNRKRKKYEKEDYREIPLINKEKVSESKYIQELKTSIEERHVKKIIKKEFIINQDFLKDDFIKELEKYVEAVINKVLEECAGLSDSLTVKSLMTDIILEREVGETIDRQILQKGMGLWCNKDEGVSCLINLFHDCTESLYSKINVNIKKYNKECLEKKKKYENLCKLLEQIKKWKESLNKKKRIEEDKLKQLEEEKKEASKNLEKGELNMLEIKKERLGIATEQYKKQKEEIRRHLDQKESVTSNISSEKARCIILLGIMEMDYNMIVSLVSRGNVGS